MAQKDFHLMKLWTIFKEYAILGNPTDCFVLTVKRNGLYEVDYYDDLNPTLESGSALLLLAYTHYHIEPTSDFSKLQLKRY